MENDPYLCEFYDVLKKEYKVTKKIEGETITSTPTLGVERSLDSGTTLRDANGKYKNKAELISILAGVLSIPRRSTNPQSH